MESEFFGHKKGSFTGAHADKPGLFQAAHGGTLFLDEVAELPLQMQVKLLRAIQEKSVRPVGASGETLVDVRILSATHKDLGDLVSDGRFRHDLYYRINVIELRVPPLRERGGDLPQLAAAIIARLAHSHGRTIPLLTQSALDALDHYGFPGNVRELENILERALPWPKTTRSAPPTCACPPTAATASPPHPAAPPWNHAKPSSTSTPPRPPYPPTSNNWNAPRSRKRWKKPLEQDQDRRAVGYHVSGAALQAQEVGDGVRLAAARLVTADPGMIQIAACPRSRYEQAQA